MIRKSIDDGELAYYHCHNPKHAGFGDLVTVAGARWPIEECFGAGKNEVGLDEYPVRTYEVTIQVSGVGEFGGCRSVVEMS